MRVLTLVTAVLLLVTGTFAQQSDKQKWCAPNSAYNFAHANNLTDLRISLHALSQLKKAGLVDKKLLSQLAQAAVFNLANVYSLRADHVQLCSIEINQYHYEMHANERFIFLLMHFSLNPDIPLTVAVKEKLAVLYLASGGKNLKLDRQIVKVIKDLKRQGKDENQGGGKQSPVYIASAKLLGEPVELNEHNFQLVPRFEFSDHGHKFAKANLGEALRILGVNNWKDNLELLASYYELGQE